MDKKLFVDRPIHKETASDAVMEAIMQAIETHQLTAGNKLPSIPQLAKSLNLGNGSVREALKRMEALGIIKIVHGRGIFVAEVDITTVVQKISALLRLKKEDIFYLMEARRTLESTIVKLATERASEEQIVELGKIITKMRLAINNPNEIIQHDLAFHEKLAEMSQNPLYITFLKTIRNLFLEEQKAGIKLPGAAQRGICYHIRIYRQVRNRFPEQAAREMARHLDDIESGISKYTKDLKYQ